MGRKLLIQAFVQGIISVQLSWCVSSEKATALFLLLPLLLFVYFECFEIESHSVVQTDMEVTAILLPHPPSAGIVGISHHARLNFPSLSLS